MGVFNSAPMVGSWETSEGSEQVSPKQEKGFFQKLKDVFWTDKEEEKQQQ